MSRISLVEAYDNRDVIGQLVRLREDVNELQNILKDIDPDGDLTNVVTKTGDQTIDGIKTFVGKIVADCDIIQLGGNYETHAEQVYSKNDYIVMRDEAVSGLAPGTYSGFQVKKYNGSDDARLVVDNEGVARVGDLNDEQPLMTRDEVADMTSGNIVVWDGVNKKAITSTKAVGDLVEGSGNIGDDTHPVKIANGQAVAVTNDLQQKMSTVVNSNTAAVATASANYNITSVTAPASGKAIINIRGMIGNSNAGYRLIGYSKNTASSQTEWLLNANSNSDFFYYSTSCIVDVNAGDVIGGCVYQTSGSTLNCSMSITMMIFPM